MTAGVSTHWTTACSTRCSDGRSRALRNLDDCFQEDIDFDGLGQVHLKPCIQRSLPIVLAARAVSAMRDLVPSVALRALIFRTSCIRLRGHRDVAQDDLRRNFPKAATPSAADAAPSHLLPPSRAPARPLASRIIIDDQDRKPSASRVASWGPGTVGPGFEAGATWASTSSRRLAMSGRRTVKIAPFPSLRSHAYVHREAPRCGARSPSPTEPAVRPGVRAVLLRESVEDAGQDSGRFLYPCRLPLAWRLRPPARPPPSLCRPRA